MELAIATLLVHLIFHLIAMSALWAVSSASFEKYKYYMRESISINSKQHLKRK